MNGQSNDVKNETGTCGSDCTFSCGSGGRMGGKWLISGVVVLAACAVVAARVADGKDKAPKAEQGFALLLGALILGVSFGAAAVTFKGQGT